MWTSDKSKFSVWQMPGGRLLTGDYETTPEEMAANAAKEVRSWKTPHLHPEARIEVLNNKKVVATEKI